MYWYAHVLSRYADFRGRARRKEYWMFTLINILSMLALVIVQEAADIAPLLTGLYSIAVVVPALAVGVRRMHDTGRSGWFVLVSFVPVLGVFLFAIFAALDSEAGPNDYGSNPKSA
ncbi:DUF805 domain-containing protein [Alkalicoccus luteus]|uniref:DUF805 domain-containing protein n=1 Tax=Alkalicoccus luteus TaxID=1237094 RepID=UPI00403415D9